jgi:hypothetical protein
VKDVGAARDRNRPRQLESDGGGPAEHGQHRRVPLLLLPSSSSFSSSSSSSPLSSLPARRFLPAFSSSPSSYPSVSLCLSPLLVPLSLPLFQFSSPAGTTLRSSPIPFGAGFYGARSPAVRLWHGAGGVSQAIPVCDSLLHLITRRSPQGGRSSPLAVAEASYGRASPGRRSPSRQVGFGRIVALYDYSTSSHQNQ